MKKLFSFCLIALVLSMLFASCAPPEDDKQKIAELTFCYDEAADIDLSMGNAMEQMVEYYNKIYTGQAHITLEKITKDPEERENQLKRMKTKILSGEGPDIFMIDTAVYEFSADVLFEDVNKSMHAGLFADINGFFSGDSDLSEDDFYQPVMDAGKIGDARYVLPIAFTYPTTYVYNDKLSADINMQKLQTNSEDYLTELMAQQIPINNTFLYFSPSPLTCFSNPIDYAGEKLNITQEELENVLGLISQYGSAQQQTEDKSDELFSEINSDEDYLRLLKTFGNDFPAKLSSFSQNNLPEIAYNIGKGNDFTEFLFPTVEGDFNALVTSMITVSASCMFPKEAFLFAKLFLTNEFQSGKGYFLDNGGETHPYGVGAISFFSDWPVRSDVDISLLYQYQSSYLRQYPLTAEDYVPLADKITSARFKTGLDEEVLLVAAILGEEYSENSVQKEVEKLYQKLLAAAAE